MPQQTTAYVQTRPRQAQLTMTQRSKKGKCGGGIHPAPAKHQPPCQHSTHLHVSIAQIEGLQRRAATPELFTCALLAGRAHAHVTSRSVGDNVRTAHEQGALAAAGILPGPLRGNPHHPIVHSRAPTSPTYWTLPAHAQKQRLGKGHKRGQARAGPWAGLRRSPVPCHTWAHIGGSSAC